MAKVLYTAKFSDGRKVGPCEYVFSLTADEQEVYTKTTEKHLDPNEEPGLEEALDRAFAEIEERLKEDGYLPEDSGSALYVLFV